MPRKRYDTVAVPIGGGMNRAPIDRKVEPPACLVAQNLTLRSRGAYSKRHGFTKVVNTTPSGIEGSSNMVVAADKLAILNSSGFHVLKTESGTSIFRSQAVGGHIPCEVTSKHLLSSRGVLSGIQMAYNSNTDQYGFIVTESDQEGGRNAIAWVCNNKFEITYGPFRHNDIGHAPRVEPVYTGTPSTSGFLFFGCVVNSVSGDTAASSSMTLKAGFSNGTEQTAFTTSTLVTLAVPYASAAYHHQIYDTYAEPGFSKAYISYLEGGNLKVASLTSGLTFTAFSFNAAGGTYTLPIGSNGGNSHVWHDLASSTVMVYWQKDDKVYSLLDDFSGSVSTLSAVGVQTDRLPTWHRRDAGAFTFVGRRRITITGSGPGTPGLGSLESPHPVYHRRPQPRNPTGCYTHHLYDPNTNPATSAVNWGDAMVSGGERLLAIDTGNVERDVVPLGQARSDVWYHCFFHRYWVSIAGPTAVAALLGVMGQSSTKGNTVLIPQIVTTNAFLPPPLQNEEYSHIIRDTATPATDHTQNRSNFGADPTGANASTPTWDVVHREGGASADAGTSRAVLTQINPASPAASVVDFYGSTLVAAGGLSTYDGHVNLPAILEKPRTIDFGNANESHTDGATSGQPGSPYLGFAGTGFEVKATTAHRFKGVLVRIDANGIKYRSDSFDLGKYENVTGATRFVELTFKFLIPTSYRTFLEAPIQETQGGTIQLELYANSYPYVAGTTVETGFDLVWRGAIVEDTVPGYPTFQFKTITSSSTRSLWDTMYPITTAGTPNAGSRDHNPTPIYTESGELGPYMPPASNVMARAGNYIFLVPSERPYELWHTKPISSFIGPEFNPVLTIAAPSDSGGIVSLAGEADRLLLLCQNGVYELFVGGDGPDVAGEGSFPPLRKLFGGEGCVNHRATQTGPFGTFFMSESGPKIVDRSGQYNDIGHSLGDFLDVTATAPSAVTFFELADLSHSTYHAKDREIWSWFTDAGALVYDVDAGQWTSSTLESLSSAMLGNVMYRELPGLELAAEDRTVSTESSLNPVIAAVQTPWIALDGVSGFQRVRKVVVHVKDLLPAQTVGKFFINLNYNYNESPTDSYTFDWSDVMAVDTNDFYVEARPKAGHQKCSAIRITAGDTVEFTGGEGGSNQIHIRWAIVGIDMEVGTKGNLIKLAQAKKK